MEGKGKMERKNKVLDVMCSMRIMGRGGGDQSFQPVTKRYAVIILGVRGGWRRENYAKHGLVEGRKKNGFEGMWSSVNEGENREVIGGKNQ